ncbi:zincin-like metallopeptidase domain-containing protein [Nemorincola caseinilytica]|uniref:Zincin-like metallopeptidase domain-containing protein n=1 Tax=Nemorincola caseinilytica TaxID=2054315 RepID=A0ABP8N5Y9_9BACT
METATANEAKTRPDVYALVTDKIIERLNAGTVPWRKPWKDAGMPRNLISGKPYRGINSLLLGMEGYEHNLFLSFDQVKKIGGKVRRGSKGHSIVYWNVPPEKQEDERTEATEEGKKSHPSLWYYTVFNVSQCDNLPERYLPAGRQPDRIPAADAIIRNMPKCPRVRHKEQRAYYHVIEDYVNMPKRRSFRTEAGYYSTLFHELVHSTGHDSRLARDGVVEMSEFGDEMYSKEELVAEIGTCYLLALANIEGEFANSAAYIQGWLGKLRNDKRLIVKAAGQAQKAVDYILNARSEKDEA